MGEAITYDEIYRRYPGEWILLGDPDLGPHLEVKSGTLLFHSPDRDSMYQKAKDMKPKSFAIVCTVKTPEDMVMVL